jgi:hypothetical protein
MGILFVDVKARDRKEGTEETLTLYACTLTGNCEIRFDPKYGGLSAERFVAHPDIDAIVNDEGRWVKPSISEIMSLVDKELEVQIARVGEDAFL